MKQVIIFSLFLLSVIVGEAQNVGIGTLTPSSPLHIKSTLSNNPLIIDGFGNQTYYSIVENGLYRGYWGSFAGNPEDVDFGTGSATTGKIHFTIQAVPKMTIDNAGYVGIGLTSPGYKLDVMGRMRVKAGTLGSIFTTAGSWLDDYRNGNDKIFAGMADSIRYGLWGNSGAGWKFWFDANNGNVGMGTLPSTSIYGERLAVSATTGNSSVAFYNGSNYGGGVASTDSTLEIFPKYGSSLCFPSFCPSGDLILIPPSTNIFTFPGNIGVGVNKPTAKMHINGNVVIGASNINPATGYKVSVDGKVICEEVKVQLNTSWPDYVFDEKYKLDPLSELEQKVMEQKHLPGIMSASEVEAEKGFAVGDLQRRMLEKLEELYRYMFELDKENKELRKEIQQLKNEK